MKSLIISTCLLTCTLLYSQEEAIIISNSLTPLHQLISGSKVGLVPPEGFVEAQSFSGFQKLESNASIMVVDVPGPIEEISKSVLNEDRLAKRKMSIHSNSRVKVNSLDGLLLEAEQTSYDASYSRKILLFGDDRNSIIIMGIYPKDSVHFEEEMNKAIMSSLYIDSLMVDPLNGILIEIDTSNTDFKFAYVAAKNAFFSLDGNIPSKLDDKTMIIIGSFADIVEAESNEDYAINYVKEFPGNSDAKVISSEEVVINGITGYEIITEKVNAEKEETSTFYSVLLFNDGYLYYFIANTLEDSKIYLETFRELSKTITLK